MLGKCTRHLCEIGGALLVGVRGWSFQMVLVHVGVEVVTADTTSMLGRGGDHVGDDRLGVAVGDAGFDFDVVVYEFVGDCFLEDGVLPMNKLWQIHLTIQITGSRITANI